jgi:hypothetical protein
MTIMHNYDKQRSYKKLISFYKVNFAEVLLQLVDLVQLNET